MMLDEYFNPLNSTNLLIFIFTFFVFDSIGSNINYFLKFPNFLRIVYWVFGLSVFVFIWFLLHIFIPFDPWYIFITLLIIGLISLPIYFKTKGPLVLFYEIIKCPFPLIFLLLVIGYLFSIISLPPYINDELAYHYYSIDAIFINPMTNWDFPNNINLYHMIPRMLDTGYVLFFSLTKTYATARLLHFLIFFSSIFSITIFFKQYFNTISAIIYSFLALFLEGLILIESTFGHVDVAAAVLANLTLITFSGYLLTKQKGFLYGAVCLLGISIGIKYTILVFIGSTALCVLFFLIIEKYQEILKITRHINKVKPFMKFILKDFLIILSLILIMGGYWYIKNFIISGNPIYPFLFACRNNIQCLTKTEFFEGFGIAFNIQNFVLIKDSLFQQNNGFFLITTFGIFASFSSFITKNKLLRILSSMILLTVFIEIIISRSVSGFFYRYYYHWVLLIPLSLALPFATIKDVKKSLYLFFLFVLITYSFFLIKTVLPITVKTINAINSSYYIQSGNLIEKYSKSKMTTSEWVEAAFPKVGSVVKWCGEDKSVVDIFYSDPVIKWFNGYEGGLYIYLINCKLVDTGILPDDKSVDLFISSTKKTHKVIYYMSVEKCNPFNPPEYTDLQVKQYYETNQRLVCRGKEILKNLYIISDNN